MALIPQRKTMSRGVIGTWANMEEDNARTGFAGAEFTSAVPVMKGEGEMVYIPLTAGNRFSGIALTSNTMYGTPTSDGAATFAVSDLFGIADMGAVFVLAGEGVVEEGLVYYDPATRKYHGESATGRLLLVGCEFDETAADGEPVAVRIRLTPGADAITAAQ